MDNFFKKIVLNIKDYFEIHNIYLQIKTNIMNKNEFIEKVNKKYGVGKYTVLGEYKNNKSKILIKCNTCGYEWETNAGNFINVCKVGCPKCACKKSHDEAKLSTKEIIKRGKELYGNRYSYDKVDSLNRDEKGRVCFTCNVCGKDFWESPVLFLRNNRRIKSNCPNCARKITEENIRFREERHKNYLVNHVYDTDSFIKKLNEKFPNFYDTSETVYVDNVTDLIIIHNGHRIITKPVSVLGSKKPILQDRVHDTKSFIKKALIRNDGKYIYDEKTKYTNANSEIIVKCKKHGYFKVIASHHLNGVGCKKCMKENKINPKKKTFEQFIEETKVKHGKRYIYDRDTFVNYNTKMRIICPIHGEFWQKPSIHISGNGHGCHKCKESSLERNTRIILEKNSINYIKSKHFVWLGQQHFDFYLPDYNIAIECQGKQHFIEGGWNNKNSLNVNIERDKSKKEKSDGRVNLVYLLDSTISKRNIIANEKFCGIYNDSNTFKNVNALIDNIIQCSPVDSSEFVA